MKILALIFVTAQASFALTFDNNVPKNIQDQMKNDIAFMGSVQGKSVTPLHQEIFGSLDGKSYTDWFSKRVNSVGFNSCGSGNAVACVIPWFANKMWITNNYIKFSHPQVARLMVVYHEARHTEADHDNFPHADCPVPFKNDKGDDMKSIWTGASLAGEPACDETPYGSYGSSTILLKNVQLKCENCTDKVKLDAEIYSADQLGRIISEDAKKKMLADFATK